MSGATYTVTAPSDVALEPPPGVIPDFQDAFTLRPYNNVAMSMSITFASIFLILRLYTKIRLVKQCRWEDCKVLESLPRTFLTGHRYMHIRLCAHVRWFIGAA